MSLQDQLNFKSVLRSDHLASRLLFTSSHAVLYLYKEAKWVSRFMV